MPNPTDRERELKRLEASHRRDRTRHTRKRDLIRGLGKGVIVTALTDQGHKPIHRVTPTSGTGRAAPALEPRERSTPAYLPPHFPALQPLGKARRRATPAASTVPTIIPIGLSLFKVTCEPRSLTRRTIKAAPITEADEKALSGGLNTKIGKRARALVMLCDGEEDDPRDPVDRRLLHDARLAAMGGHQFKPSEAYRESLADLVARARAEKASRRERATLGALAAERMSRTHYRVRVVHQLFKPRKRKGNPPSRAVVQKPRCYFPNVYHGGGILDLYTIRRRADEALHYAHTCTENKVRADWHTLAIQLRRLADAAILSADSVRRTKNRDADAESGFFDVSSRTGPLVQRAGVFHPPSSTSELERVANA